MIKGETPSPSTGSSTFQRTAMHRGRIFKVVRLPQRNSSTHTAETAWLNTVAMAAPRTPMPKTKMKTGSRRMFSAAPIITVSMLVLAKPWEVINMFMPREICTNTVPHT